MLDPAQASALASAALLRADLGPLQGSPLVAVDLRAGDGGRDLTGLERLAVVTVGVGPPHDALDVTVADLEELGRLEAAVEANPMAAVTLVQLLRLGRHLPPADALVAESLAYATLQAGPEFARWLTARGARTRRREAEPPILVRREGDLLHLELNRPRLHNLYNAAMRDALVEALALAVADRGLQIVLSGRGRSFCAGGDPAEFGTSPDPASAHLIRTSANAAPLLVEVGDRLDVLVHGAAVGAGIELAAFAATVRSRPDATFRLPEVSMGLIPGAGGTVSVTRRVGRHRAAWMMLTGEPVDAPTAAAWGLVDELTDDPGD